MMKVRLPDFMVVYETERLIRLGRDYDGGYLVNQEDVNEARELISLGVFDDWSFEQDFIDLNEVPVTAYDGSINFKFWLKRSVSEILRNPFNLYFIKKFLSYRKFFSHDRKLIKKYVGLETLAADHITFTEAFTEVNTDRVFLKIDIEGSEYRILNEILQHQQRLVGAVIEFHDCDIHLERIKTFVEQFNLQIIHVHANNYGGLRSSDNLPLVLEISFSSKNFKGRRHKVYHHLDMANNPKNNDYLI